MTTETERRSRIARVGPYSTKSQRVAWISSKQPCGSGSFALRRVSRSELVGLRLTRVQAMQIFFGACLFFIAVILLAYIPGKLVLLLLKRTLSPLEDVTLACVLGLLVSGLVYWLITFAHQARLYVLWPLATTAVFIWLHSSRWKSLLRQSKLAPLDEESARRSCDRSHLALVGVVALGVAGLALLPQYYTNLTRRPDGTMRVRPIPDVFLHIAFANELTHTVPPQNPVFSGYPLTYHYGMDLAVAMFANATGLNTRDLTLRFVPTLFLALSMLSVFCFSRSWLSSGYFAVLVVFLVFFGEDFAFIPGLLQGEKGNWSVRYFSHPTVLSLFYTNPMLPGVGLLFAGLFCVQRYLREHGGAWLVLSALLLVALIEVKVFTAAHVMCSLGFAAVVYLLLFRNADLFKVAALTAALAAPLVLSVYLGNRRGADWITAFDPLLDVSQMVEVLGMKNRLTGVVAFTGIVLPIYLVGCLGLRVIGVPAILGAIFRPNRESGLRFVLAFFVVIGVIISLTCRTTPAGSARAFNNIGWLFAQSKYVAWIFAVAVLQTLYRRVVVRGVRPSLAAAGITAAAVALSVPATVQHFALESDPYRLYGRPLGKESKSYSLETLSVIDFLTKDALPGDVVLPGDNLPAPILALTKCRVPLGDFSQFAVALSDHSRRETAVKEFWKAWRLGNVRNELLREAGVDYVAVSKRTEGVPATIPAAISKVFENSEYAVFKVQSERMSEKAPQAY
jgi:hypothetical protein